MLLRVLALFLVLLGSARAEPVTLWYAYLGNEQDALNQVVASWNEAHPDSPVVAMQIPFEAYANRLETTIPRGNGPDLFIFSTEKIQTWARTGLVDPVETDPSAYIPVTIEGATVDGRILGWPLNAKSLALYVNKALLPLAEVPGDSVELFEYASRMKSAGSWGLAFVASESYFAIPWMNGFGGGVFDAQGRVALHRPENAAALDYVARLARLGPADPTGALISQVFNEGRAALVVSGPWFAAEIASSIDYTVVPMPVVRETGRPAAPLATIEALFLAHGARNPEGARQFGEYLATSGAAPRAALGGQPVAYKAAWEDPGVVGNEFLQAFRRQLEAAVPMPSAPEMALTWEPLSRAVRRANRQAATGDEALEEAQALFEFYARPLPEPTSPTPYLLLVGALGLGLVLYVVRNTRGAELRRFGFAYGWVAPAFTAILLLVVAPFLVGGAISLFAHQDGEWSFVGLANFVNILLSRDFPITSPRCFYYTLGVTVLWTVVNVAIAVALGVLLAMILREPWVRLRGFWRVVLILPWAVPSYITALVWKGLFHREMGAINAILGALGVEPVGWFDTFWRAFSANLATNTWLGFPFMMVVTLGALQAIPRDMEEAAELDGASGWQRFRHVILPLLAPALLPAVILGIIWTFNQFNVIYLVSAGEPDDSTGILISETYRWAFERRHQYGYAAAYAVIIFGILLLYGRFANRLAGRKVI
jgi:arabinogalactan oligomer/maltooligosaccharide transport system permease protein